MCIVSVIFILLAHKVGFGLSFSYQELLQAAPLNEQLPSVNCTFREINSGTCMLIDSNNDNFESSAQMLSSLPAPLSEPEANNSLLRLPHSQVWIYSIGSAFFISLSGLWGYLLLPLLNGVYQSHVMNVLVGLSCGSLVTSSLCQLIPEAYELWLLSPNYVHISIFSMFGVWVILLGQNFATVFRKVTVEKESSVGNTKKLSANNSDLNYQKSRHGGASLPITDVDTTHPLFSHSTNDILKSKTNVNSTITGVTPATDIELKVPPSFIAQSRCSFQSLGLTKKAKLSKLAIIVLAGDFMNNFMDGISIGASYCYLLSTGLKLTTAISFEEYTHKLGDFAIVFQSGISMKRVLFWNYFTSCACFLGVVIGIALGNLNWSKYIFSIASGLFLYIALSNMIPEMQKMIEESLKISKKVAIISLIEQHIGFILAFIALIIISTALNTAPPHP